MNGSLSALFEQCQIVAGFDELRVQGESALEMFASLRLLALHEADGAEPFVCLGKVGLQFNRSPQIRLSG